MSTFDPLAKAKKVAEQATQAALGIKEHATQAAQGVKEQTAATTAGIRDLAVHKAEEAATLMGEAREHAAARMGEWKELLVAKIADIKDAAFSGVEQMVGDLNQHLPALREAGYNVAEVAIELGLTPKVVATFVSQPDISEERIDAVIEEHRDAKVTIALLRALYAAYKLQNGVHVAGLRREGLRWRSASRRPSSSSLLDVSKAVSRSRDTAAAARHRDPSETALGAAFGFPSRARIGFMVADLRRWKLMAGCWSESCTRRCRAPCSEEE